MSEHPAAASAMSTLPSASKSARRVVLILSAVVLAVLIVFMVKRLSEASAKNNDMAAQRATNVQAAQLPPEIAVVSPRAGTWQPQVVLSGTLEPIQAADLGFEVPGRIRRVFVSLGDHVDAGDPLAELDRAGVGAQAAQTAAGIAIAQANLALVQERTQRVLQLAERGAAPEAERVAAEQQLELARAQVAQATSVRRATATVAANHMLRAPFSGVITRTPTGPGAVVGPGVPLFRVEDLSSMRLRSSVSETELASLALDMDVRIPDAASPGKLRALVRSLDAQTRRAPVEVIVGNAQETLIGNALVRAQIDIGSPQAVLLIPGSARRADGTVIVVGEGNRTVARPVRAEPGVDGQWNVTAGLAASDRVAVRASEIGGGVLVRPIDRSAGPASPAPSTPTAEPR